MDPLLDATAQADLVRAGEVTPRELVEGAIERIEALNPELNAVIHPLFEEALATDYPALKHFLGDDGFLALVRGYVEAHPSRSYSLNRLGDRLPDYVSQAPGLRRRAFCHDLARLELALSEVFDAPRSAVLGADGRAQLRSWLARRDTFTVTLGRPLPVRTVYETAWVDARGVVQFRDDLYARSAPAAANVTARRADALRSGLRTAASAR